MLRNTQPHYFPTSILFWSIHPTIVFTLYPPKPGKLQNIHPTIPPSQVNYKTQHPTILQHLSPPFNLGYLQWSVAFLSVLCQNPIIQVWHENYRGINSRTVLYKHLQRDVQSPRKCSQFPTNSLSPPNNGLINMEESDRYDSPWLMWTKLWSLELVIDSLMIIDNYCRSMFSWNGKFCESFTVFPLV